MNDERTIATERIRQLEGHPVSGRVRNDYERALATATWCLQNNLVAWASMWIQLAQELQKAGEETDV